MEDPLKHFDRVSLEGEGTLGVVIEGFAQELYSKGFTGCEGVAFQSRMKLLIVGSDPKMSWSFFDSAMAQEAGWRKIV